jgi:hypothetical protein
MAKKKPARKAATTRAKTKTKAKSKTKTKTKAKAGAKKAAAKTKAGAKKAGAKKAGAKKAGATKAAAKTKAAGTRKAKRAPARKPTPATKGKSPATAPHPTGPVVLVDVIEESLLDVSAIVRIKDGVARSQRDVDEDELKQFPDPSIVVEAVTTAARREDDTDETANDLPDLFAAEARRQKERAADREVTAQPKQHNGSLFGSLGASLTDEDEDEDEDAEDEDAP